MLLIRDDISLTDSVSSDTSDVDHNDVCDTSSSMAETSCMLVSFTTSESENEPTMKVETSCTRITCVYVCNVLVHFYLTS